MKIITITNQKGGVGKTTTAINLAAGLARMGKRVLLADFDPQGNAAYFLGLEKTPGTYSLLAAYIPSLAILLGKNAAAQIRSCVAQARENFDILPGENSIAEIQTKIEQSSIHLIRKAVTDYFLEYDFVILDTAPSISGILALAAYAADIVIVPVSCQSGSIDGLEQTVVLLNDLKKKGWEGGLLGILPTKFDERLKESRMINAYIARKYQNQHLSPIHQSADLESLPNYRATIFEKAEADKKKNSIRAANEYEALARKVARR